MTIKPEAATPSRDGDVKEERRVPLLKAMQIVERIATSDQTSWGVRELARALDMAPSSTHRLLAMLEEASVLESEPDTGRYVISLDFFRLASRIANKLPLRETASRFLRGLAERTGEAVYVARYDARRRGFMFVDHLRSRHPLRYELPLYEWLDLRVGAGGLGILAFLEQEELEAVLDEAEPDRLTDLTITERHLIEEEIERVRQQGYVVSVGRRIPDAAGIAAPIWGASGRVIGAVVLALPKSRLPEPQEMEDLATDVVGTARAVSSVMGEHVLTALCSNLDLINW